MIIHESGEVYGGNPAMINGTPEWNEIHGDSSLFQFNPGVKVHSTPNSVNHPSHYNDGKVECIDAIEAALGKDGFEAFIIGNVIKYLWRYKHKNGDEDLKKAEWYLNHLLQIKDQPKSNLNNKSDLDKETPINLCTVTSGDTKKAIAESRKNDLLQKILAITKSQIDLMGQMEADEDGFDCYKKYRDKKKMNKGKERDKGDESVKPK